MKVVVTGGAGYLGAVLCEELLKANFQVAVIDNLLYQQHSLFHLCSRQSFQFTCGDVRNEELVRSTIKGADVIIPLAAIVGAPACERDPRLAKSVNLEAIQLLLKLRSPSQLIVFPTTNSGYGTKSGDSFCTEDTLLEPISLYGKTKVQAEQELLNTPNVVTLRLATVFGMSPRMRLDLLVNNFVYQASQFGYLVIFEKDFKRNFIHIRDVAACMLHCIENASQMVGRPYNAGLDSANLSKEELAKLIQTYVPNFYVHYASIGSDPDQRNYIVSNHRLRETGFQARRPLGDGIQELLKGYRMVGRALFGNV